MLAVEPTREAIADNLSPIEENEQPKFSFIFRVKLDVTVNAPIIILPYEDNQALLLDCGLITVQTNLDLDENYYESSDVSQKEQSLNERCKLPPLIEIQSISLSNMEISRFFKFSLWIFYIYFKIFKKIF